MFNWNLRVFKDNEGIITEVHWILYVDIDGELHKGSVGSVSLPSPEGKVVPFDDVSEELAMEWLLSQNKEGWKEATEAKALENVNKKLNPESVEAVPAGW